MDTDIAEVKKTDFKKGAKKQYAYNYIKERIVKNIYKPQQMLSESDLSKEMGGISRTPIRDALRCLMYEGFVESIPGKGMFVSDLRFEDVLEIMEVRTWLHTNAVRLFVQRASDNDIEKMGEILNMHIEAFKKGDYFRAIELDHQFHLEAVKGTRNSRLYTLCQNYVEIIARASYFTTSDPVRVKQSVDEHIAVYEAIKRHDEEKAASLEKAHFEGFANYFTYTHINRYSPFTQTNITI